MTNDELELVQAGMVMVFNQGMVAGVLLGLFLGWQMPGFAWWLEYRLWPRIRRLWKWRSRGVKPAPKG